MPKLKFLSGFNRECQLLYLPQVHPVRIGYTLDSNLLFLLNVLSISNIVLG